MRCRYLLIGLMNNTVSFEVEVFPMVSKEAAEMLEDVKFKLVLFRVGGTIDVEFVMVAFKYS